MKKFLDLKNKEAKGFLFFVSLGIITMMLLSVLTDITDDYNQYFPAFAFVCILIFIIEPFLRQKWAYKSVGLIMVEVYILLAHFAVVFSNYDRVYFFLYLIPVFSAGMYFALRGTALVSCVIFFLYIVSKFMSLDDAAIFEIIYNVLPNFIILFLGALMIGFLSEEKSRVERKIYKKISTINTLKEVSKIVRETTQFHSLLKNIIEVISILIPVEHAVVFTAEGKEFLIHSKKSDSDLNIEIDGAEIKKYLIEKKYFFIKETEKRLKKQKIYSLLGAKITDEKDFTGGIILANQKEEVYFTEDDFDVFKALMSQINLALLNSMLYKKSFETSQLLKFIIKSIGAGVITVDNEGVITSVNNSACRLLNFKEKNEILNKKLNKDLFLFEEYCLILKTLTSAAFYDSQETVMVTKDHKKIYVGLSTAYLTDDADNRIGAVAVFKDLSKIKEIQQELETSRRLASLGQMAANVAHELRNPLGGIMGLLSIAMSNIDRDKKIEKPLLEKIMSGLQTIENVISEFLNFTEEKPLEITLADLKEIFEDITANLETELHRKNITLKGNYGETLYIKCDKAKFKRALFNIIKNAVDAVADSGEINIDIEKKDDLTIKTKDNGIGIKKEDMEKVMNPFFTTKKDGVGLGLSIAQKTLFNHNGNLKIKSTEGQGTEVIVKIKG